MFNKINKVYIGILLLILAIIGVCTYKMNFTVAFSFVLNGVLALVLIFKSIRKNAYSLEMIHWIFFFLFFFLAPLVQYSSSLLRYGFDPSMTEVVVTNLLLFLWGIIVFFSSTLASVIHIKQINVPPVRISNRFISLVSIINIILSAYLIKSIGFTNMIMRGTSVVGIESLTSSQSLNTLIITFIRAFITFSTALIIFRNRKEKDSYFASVLNGLMLLIICSPTGMARYAAGTIYLGILLFTIDWMKAGNRFIMIFLSIMLFLFPFFSLFRALTFEKSIFDYINVFSVFSNFITSDYDAYTMFYLSREYIIAHGMTNWNQFLGAVFFWFPRSFWMNKPIGSGDTVIRELSTVYRNVSMPLPGEGIINFGILGMVLFAMIVGLAATCLDRKYWSNKNRGDFSLYTTLDLVYPFLILLFFFVMRGDLLSTFAFSFGYLFVGSVMFKLAKFL